MAKRSAERRASVKGDKQSKPRIPRPSARNLWRFLRRVPRFLLALFALCLIILQLALIWGPFVLVGAIALLYFLVLWLLPVGTVLAFLLWGSGVLAAFAGLAFSFGRTFPEDDPARRRVNLAGARLFHAALLLVATAVPAYAELRLVNDITSLAPRALPRVFERPWLPLERLDVEALVRWLASDGFRRLFNLVLLILSLLAAMSTARALWILFRTLHFREYALFGRAWPEWAGLRRALVFREAATDSATRGQGGDARMTRNPPTLW